jgi:hypothetical protein
MGKADTPANAEAMTALGTPHHWWEGQKDSNIKAFVSTT